MVETSVDKDGLVRRVKICLGDRKLNKMGKRLNKPSVVENPKIGFTDGDKFDCHFLIATILRVDAGKP